MEKTIIKYNPEFLSDEELIESFVVRNNELSLILDIIRNNTGSAANQHILVIGPRGSGKTTLVQRVAAEVRRDKAISESWYALRFAEESYEVSTPGEFWLEALFHLGVQTKDKRWYKIYEELKSEQDETRLRERALAQLLNFADGQNKRLMIIVENLQMLLGEQITPDGAWELRHTLLNEPRIMMISSANSHFDLIDVVGHAMYDLFRIIELKALSESECRGFWQSRTKEELELGQIQPIRILTGGNPRLLVILTDFITKQSFADLMRNLTQLVDDHTDYFKSHLDSLPAKERKIFVALADLWDPSTAREIAKAARVDVSLTSAQLARLEMKGAVEVIAKKRGKRKYQVTERLYNIYYLIRRRGGPSSRVKALVQFMVTFYSGKDDKLLRSVKLFTEEAKHLSKDEKSDHIEFLANLIHQIEAPKLKFAVFTECAGADLNMFENHPDVVLEIAPEWSMAALYNTHKKSAIVDDEDANQLFMMLQDRIEANQADSSAWARLAFALQTFRMEYDKAEDAFKKALACNPEEGSFWFLLGLLLHFKLSRFEEAESAYRSAIKYQWDYSAVWIAFGLLQVELDRHGEAENAFKEGIKREPGNGYAWFCLGVLLHVGFERYEEAEKAFRNAIKYDPEIPAGWFALGVLLHEQLERYEEAEKCYRHVMVLEPNYPDAWSKLGDLLYIQLDNPTEAEGAYRKAMELGLENPWLYVGLGELVREHKKNYIEAEELFRKSIDMLPKNFPAWFLLGTLLLRHSDRYEEAEEAFRKSIEFLPDFDRGWAGLFRTKLKQQKLDDAVKVAEKCLVSTQRSPLSLNFLAWALFEEGEMGTLQQAEDWAKEALEKEPDNSSFVHSLASILGRQGKWSEALALTPAFLKDIEHVEEHSNYVTDFVIEAAAAGYGSQILSLLVNSAGIEALEPLAVGVRIHLGEDVSVAQEVLEVGKDVATRIKTLQNKQCS